jgi:hypothetical protein
MAHLRRTLIPAGVLLWAALRPCRADDLFEYKHAVYAESDGRMKIVTQSALVQAGLGQDTQLKFTGTDDAIAGATPTGVPIDVAEAVGANWIQSLHDHRKAWSADAIRQQGSVQVDAGFAYSREHDYTSYGWSVNTLTDFNRKNTTLLAGVAGTEDDVEEPLFGNLWTRKHSGSAALGVTQLLSPQTTITLNLTWERMTGYLSDQYKIVEKAVPILPGIPPLVEFFAENRPNFRDKGTAYVEVNHAVRSLNGALDASFRYYRDTYGVAAGTAEVAWLQHIGRYLILTPSFRLHRQGAADFYHYRLDDTAIMPVAHPRGTGTFYSSDYRLSRMETRDYGIKAVVQPTRWLELDAAFDEYTLRGRDGITPQILYPLARITTLGAQISW